MVRKTLINQQIFPDNERIVTLLIQNGATPSNSKGALKTAVEHGIYSTTIDSLLHSENLILINS